LFIKSNIKFNKSGIILESLIIKRYKLFNDLTKFIFKFRLLFNVYMSILDQERLIIFFNNYFVIILIFFKRTFNISFIIKIITFNNLIWMSIIVTLNNIKITINTINQYLQILVDFETNFILFLLNIIFCNIRIVLLKCNYKAANTLLHNSFCIFELFLFRSDILLTFIGFDNVKVGR
jgi:hypothetical protein